MKIQIVEEFIEHLNEFIKKFCELINASTSLHRTNPQFFYDQLDELVMGYVFFLQHIECLSYTSLMQKMQWEKIETNPRVSTLPKQEIIARIVGTEKFPENSITTGRVIDEKKKEFKPFKCEMLFKKTEIQYAIGIRHFNSNNEMEIYGYSIHFYPLEKQWFKYFDISKEQLNECIQRIENYQSIETFAKINNTYSLQEIKRGTKFYYETSLKTHIQNKKIIKALNAMLFTNTSLKIIAYQSGFTGYKSLHRTFQTINLPLKSIPRLKK